jgi:hypothetical protein
MLKNRKTLQLTPTHLEIEEKLLHILSGKASSNTYKELKELLRETTHIQY